MLGSEDLVDMILRSRLNLLGSEDFAEMIIGSRDSLLGSEDFAEMILGYVSYTNLTLPTIRLV